MAGGEPLRGGSGPDLGCAAPGGAHRVGADDQVSGLIADDTESETPVADVEAMDCALDRILVRMSRAHSARWVPDQLAWWRSWELFADHHGVDPWAPSQEAVVAFVQARTLAGVGYASLNSTLGVMCRALTDEEVVRPARRHLAELHAEGAFGPGLQAAVLTLGQVLGLAEAAAADALTSLLVVGSYRAALRPGEWTCMRYPDHVGFGPRERPDSVPEVTLVIPCTKRGAGRTVTVTPTGHPGLSLWAALYGWHRRARHRG
jgi:hypothetical protein